MHCDGCTYERVRLQVYVHTLGVNAEDDVKYVYGYQVLHGVLEVLRAKKMGRADVHVRRPSYLCSSTTLVLFVPPA